MSYNGWTNYLTFMVGSALQEEKEVKQLARETYDNAYEERVNELANHPNDVTNKPKYIHAHALQVTAKALSDRLIEELYAEGYDGNGFLTTTFVEYALEQVDFEDIAENLVG